MTAADDTLAELLRLSLAAWDAKAELVRAGPGVFVIHAAAHDMRIERAAPGVPFRWSVTIDGRRRVAASLVGVLRQVRAALDSGYAANRVRIAVSPLALQ